MCGLSSHPSAQRCDCGFDFSTNRLEKSYLKQSARPVRGGYLARLTTTDGRMSRTSFLVFQLGVAGVIAAWFAASAAFGPDGPIDWLGLVLVPALGLTSITTLVQRLHDAGHSGYWALLGTWAVLFGLVALSDRDNEYGEASSAW